jgi:uncharacterized protein YecE (DUF72 family)
MRFHAFFNIGRALAGRKDLVARTRVRYTAGVQQAELGPGRLLIGTAGYSYTDWEGTLYPPGTPKERYLELYAAEFPVVELNFSYYTMPQARTLERMINVTPEGFLFSIKAHQSLTHTVGEDLPDAAERFRQGIQPLTQGGRLAAVLFQFPYRFHYTPEARRHLQALCEAFAELPKAVEFRSDEWQRESVYEGLARWNAAYVNVDAPPLARLPRPSDTATSEMGYVRFHGRNRANWWRGDNASRYDYLYDSEELEGWLPRIERLLARVRLALVIFNNHPGGKAVTNARDLMRRLSG